MKIEQIEARLAAIEARLNKLDGGEVETKTKAPASKVNFVKREVNEFPKWVYIMDGDEVKTALIKCAEDMPEGAAESPEEARAGDSKPIAAPETKSDVIEVPEDWRSIHHSTRIKLAKSLPGGDDVVSDEDAIALIEMELESRGDT